MDSADTEKLTMGSLAGKEEEMKEFGRAQVLQEKSVNVAPLIATVYSYFLKLRWKVKGSNYIAILLSMVVF